MRMPKIKAVSVELEGFIDWAAIAESEAVEEKEMFSLATGFTTRMRKRAMIPEGETTSSFGEK